MGAREVVDCLSLYKLRVGVPPSHTAFVGAEFLFTLVGCVFDDGATGGAFLLIWVVGVFFAIILDLVQWQIQHCCDFSVSVSLLLKGDDFVFFLHCLTSLFVFFTPQLEISRAK